MKPSIIRCSKCGYNSNIISDTCLKCGSQLVKICGACETPNAVEKNYCDSCGGLLALKIFESQSVKQEDKAKQEENNKKNENKEKRIIEFESIHETVTGRDESFRRKQEEKRKETEDQKNKKELSPLVSEKKDEIKDERVLATQKEKDIISNYAAKPNIEDKPKPESVENKKSKTKLYVSIITGAAILFLAVYAVFLPKMPKIKLVMTSKKYLYALKERNYSQAYEYLSTNSKSSCNFTEYVKNNENYYSKISGWEFKDLKVFYLSQEGAVIRYMLREGTGTWKEDYISFVKEHDKWVRPYIWNQFFPIDEAISRGDFSQALFLAQKIYLTDPVDPRTSGYLCSAEYLMGLYDKSAESCKRTLEGEKSYPVGFSRDEVFWFTFYFADSLRFLAKFDEAIEIYDLLFGYEDVSLKNKCPLLMSRADAYVRKKDYDKAYADINASVAACPEGINKKEAIKRFSFFSQDGFQDAIALAKKAKMNPDTPTLIEMRNSQLDIIRQKDLKKEFLISDSWRAQKEEGPEFSVSVFNETVNKKTGKKQESEVYKVKVNLWTGSVKMVSQ